MFSTCSSPFVPQTKPLLPDRVTHGQLSTGPWRNLSSERRHGETFRHPGRMVRQVHPISVISEIVAHALSTSTAMMAISVTAMAMRHTVTSEGLAATGIQKRKTSRKTNGEIQRTGTSESMPSVWMVLCAEPSKHVSLTTRIKSAAKPVGWRSASSMGVAR